jgi:alpha-tubulin suppressor-like RCC1 family protein
MAQLLLLALLLGGLLGPGRAMPAAAASPGLPFAWGSNEKGQLGYSTGQQDYSMTPSPVSNLVDVTAVAGGAKHSLALKSDGTVWAWGLNDSGQLGDGSIIKKTVPTQVKNLTGVIAIAAGGYHSLALKSDNTVWAWGANDDGQLGDGTTGELLCKCRKTPVQVKQGNGALTDVTAIAAGGSHSLALRGDEKVWAWGSNSQRQLGYITAPQDYSATPQQIPNLSNVLAIAAGGSHSLAVKQSNVSNDNAGTVWTWGWNVYGQLGYLTNQQPNGVPKQVGALDDVVAIEAGEGHSLALKSDGKVWSWGHNDVGQLGYSTGQQSTSVLPAKISGLADVTAIAAGASHSLALKSDEKVWSWGHNNVGQLGYSTGQQNYSTTPGPVGGLTGVGTVAAGSSHNLAVSAPLIIVVPVFFTMTLSTAGSGTVAASPSGPVYLAGIDVIITATPNPGQVFAGWTVDGVPQGAANPLTLTMNSDHTVVATFAPVPEPPQPPQPPAAPVYSLALSAEAGGSASGGGSYSAGTVATLVATPDAGQVFLGWTVDGAFAGWANPLTITMNGDHAVAAAFAPRPSFPDVPADHPAYEAISQLAARGVIKGYADGRFGPADATLRAQMAALIARALGWDQEDHGNTFPDRGSVDANLWRNVGTLAYYGVAKGYQDGSYKPTAPVLNAQVISFVTRAMEARGYWQAQPDDPAVYPNVPASSGHRADLATYAFYAGAVPGTEAAAGWGGWAQPSTRGWFALAQWQALNSYFSVDRVP